MKVLIVKLSSLGDLFHALPAVHNLKEGLGAEIHWVVADTYAGLLRECFTDVARVIPFRRRAFWSNLRPFLADLRAAEYDYVIDLHGLLKSAMIALMARGRLRIGPSFAREGTRFLYPRLAGRRREGRHVVEQCLDVVDALKLQRMAPVFPVRFPPRQAALPRPRVGIVPMSRRPNKTWPESCFADVARRLARTRGASVYLFGGQEDREVCGRIAAAAGGAAEDLSGRLDFAALGGTLAQMDLVVSNDSGPAHMAAAVGVPVLAIFASTDPARNGPYGAGHRVVTASLPCQPCFSRACRQPGVPCLQGVTPEQVGEVALEMLSRRDAAGAPRAEPRACACGPDDAPTRRP